MIKRRIFSYPERKEGGSSLLFGCGLGMIFGVSKLFLGRGGGAGAVGITGGRGALGLSSLIVSLPLDESYLSVKKIFEVSPEEQISIGCKLTCSLLSLARALTKLRSLGFVESILTILFTLK